MQDDIPIWVNPNRNPPAPTDDDLPVWVNPNRKPAPPPLPLPTPQPPVDTRSTFQKFLDWANRPTLPEAEPYPLYKTKQETIPDMLDPSKTREVTSETNEKVPYSFLKQIANEFSFEPYNQLVVPASAPLGLAALAVEGGAGLYGHIQNRNAINAAAEAYRQKPKVSVEYLRGLNARPGGEEPPIDVQATSTYTGPRQLQGIGPEEVPPMTETYNGPRQITSGPPRRGLPARGESSPTRTFYQGRAGTTLEGQDYPVDTAEPGRVPGYNPYSPQGTLANLPAIDVAERGQQHGQLARSVGTNFGEPEKFGPVEPNQVIGTQTEQGLQSVEPVTPPEPKAIATNPLYEIRQEGNGTYSVVNTVTGKAMVSSTSQQTADLIFNAVKTVEKPEVAEPTPTQALEPVKPIGLTLPEKQWTSGGDSFPKGVELYKDGNKTDISWRNPKTNMGFFVGKVINQDGEFIARGEDADIGRYPTHDEAVKATLDRSGIKDTPTPEPTSTELQPVEPVTPEPTPETKPRVSLVKKQGSELSETTVVVDGKPIGDVYKGWFRLGGSSWTHSQSPGGGFPTRLDAIQNLISKSGIKIKQSEVGQALSGKPKTELQPVEPEAEPTPTSTGLQPVEPIAPEQPPKPRGTLATLPYGSVNQEGIDNPEYPFRVSTPPIEPGKVPAVFDQDLPTAEKPELRPGGEVLEKPSIQPPFRTDTLTPEEARALKGEATPVQPSGGPLPPFRTTTLTPEEAQTVRGQPEFEPAPKEPTSPDVGVPFRKETLTGDEGSAAFRASREADINKAEARAARARKKYADEVEFERRKAKAAKEGTKPVEPVEDAQEPVLKAGQATPGRDVSGFRANFGSPDKTLLSHPDSAGVAKPIIDAYNAKVAWIRSNMERLAPFVKGLSTAARETIGKILDTGNTAGIDPDLIRRADGIREILDGVHKDIQDVPGGKPTVGYITNYFTHMAKEDTPGLFKSFVNLFKRGKLGQALGAGQGDLYEKGLGNPSSPYVEPRTGQLTQLDYDIKNVLPKYLASLGKYKFDAPAVRMAKLALDKMPGTSIMKELAGWYVKNYTRYDSEAKLHKVWGDLANAAAGKTARAFVDFNPVIHLLHLGELPSSVWPELGSRYATYGMGQVLKNPLKTFNEMARLGLLQGEFKPLAFRTAGEKWQSLAQFMNMAETLVKGTSYAGAKKMFMDRGMSPAEASAKALEVTKRTTYVVDPTTQMRGLSPESNVMGGEVGHKEGWQFKGAPTKVAEQLMDTAANVAKDPKKAVRAVVGAGVAIAATNAGLHMFHMNMTDVIGATALGATGTTLFRLARDVYTGKADKFAIDMAAWLIPGGQMLRKLGEATGDIKPVSKGSQNISKPSPVGSVLGGGLQAKGTREVQPVS